ncbi:ABC transporter ATP-binding protein [Corynebacterium provencense]|uniref:ABC transporter ATP-binding protein n=1 Tax=Corynebacterium provencense TaxID=1737425 RepID=UPI00082EA27D|nr:ABC transporter ATP-binding protein [Corynebacterium provencense]
MIEARDLAVRFGPVTAVDGVSLTVADHGVLGLVGPNGSGKTTLLRCLYGALGPTSGDVLLDGTSLSAMHRRAVARRIAVVAQEHHDPATPISVAELVMLGRLPHQGIMAQTTDEDRTTVVGALESVGLGALAARDVAVLSGGERQRALIARALAQQAGHVLLDEPTNHLDIRFQHDVLELVSELPGAAVVLHDLNLAARYCDRIVVLDAGKVVAAGTPSQVLVPEILEPVYKVRVRRVEFDGEMHLLFPR